MRKNTLYLRKMGMNDNEITTDIKNHRVITTKNIDIMYKGKKYNMFFEFLQANHWKVRTTNKRTGEKLKRPVTEMILTDALGMNTQYEKMCTDETGRSWEMSYRLSALESDVWNEHHSYTKHDILEVINHYKIGDKFTEICLID